MPVQKRLVASMQLMFKRGREIITLNISRILDRNKAETEN